MSTPIRHTVPCAKCGAPVCSLVPPSKLETFAIRQMLGAIGMDVESGPFAVLSNPAAISEAFDVRCLAPECAT